MIKYVKKILRHLFISFKLKKYKTKFITTDWISKNTEIKNSNFHFEVRVAEFASIKNTEIGELSSIGRNTKITYTEIGKYCAISWDVTINAISHPINHLSISAFPYVPSVGNFVETRIQQHSKVKIMNDVWIGAHSIIMPGITIGNGAIIGAGAVVTKNVPDYAVVAGVPAKIIKYRFDQDTIKRLLDCQWWSLDREFIKSNIHLFQSELEEKKLEKLESLCEKSKSSSSH